MVSFVDTRMLHSKLSCLLCSSASIGSAPSKRYTALVAVLLGMHDNRAASYINFERMHFIGKCKFIYPIKDKLTFTLGYTGRKKEIDFTKCQKNYFGASKTEMLKWSSKESTRQHIFVYTRPAIFLIGKYKTVLSQTC